MKPLSVVLAVGAVTVGVVSGAYGAGSTGSTGSTGATGAVPASVTAVPLHVTLSLTEARAGSSESVRATATVTNIGRTALSRLQVELRSDPGGLRVTGSNPYPAGQLAPGAVVTRAWTVCGRGPATLVLMAQARGTLPVGSVVAAESEARLVTVAGPPACR